MHFNYKSVRRPNGGFVKCPMVPVTITGNSAMRIEFMALLDSGADLSVIPKDVAELLNLDIHKETSKSKGIGGDVNVINTNLLVNISKGHESYNINLPVQIILNNENIPVILGRAGFFDEFDILFDQKNQRVSLKKIFPNKF